MHSIVQYFKFEHLPEKLQEISMPFGALAHFLDATLPNDQEKEFALRKLLEAKDCAVRSFMNKQ